MTWPSQGPGTTNHLPWPTTRPNQPLNEPLCQLPHQPLEQRPEQQSDWESKLQNRVFQSEGRVLLNFVVLISPKGLNIVPVDSNSSRFDSTGPRDQESRFKVIRRCVWDSDDTKWRFDTAQPQQWNPFVSWYSRFAIHKVNSYQFLVTFFYIEHN